MPQAKGNELKSTAMWHPTQKRACGTNRPAIGLNNRLNLTSWGFSVTVATTSCPLINMAGFMIRVGLRLEQAASENGCCLSHINSYNLSPAVKKIADLFITRYKYTYNTSLTAQPEENVSGHGIIRIPLINPFRSTKPMRWTPDIIRTWVLYFGNRQIRHVPRLRTRVRGIPKRPEMG